MDYEGFLMDGCGKKTYLTSVEILPLSRRTGTFQLKDRHQVT
jgi:hypothetical protein